MILHLLACAAAPEIVRTAPDLAPPPPPPEEEPVAPPPPAAWRAGVYAGSAPVKAPAEATGEQQFKGKVAYRAENTPFESVELVTAVPQQ